MLYLHNNTPEMERCKNRRCSRDHSMQQFHSALTRTASAPIRSPNEAQAGGKMDTSNSAQIIDFLFF